MLQKMNAFSVVAFQEHVYIFGGAKGLTDATNEVLIMNQAYEWSKFGQTLATKRRDHITLVKGELIFCVNPPG